MCRVLFCTALLGRTRVTGVVYSFWESLPMRTFNSHMRVAYRNLSPTQENYKI